MVERGFTNTMSTFTGIVTDGQEPGALTDDELKKRGVHLTQVTTTFGADRNGQPAKAPVLSPYAASTTDGCDFAGSLSDHNMSGELALSGHPV